MDVPPIQYCRTSDGVSIAYWTMGEGGTPLVLTAPTSNSHIALECEVPQIAELYQQLSRKRMIVRFDDRGTGLSQRDLTDEQIGHIWASRDMGAVVDSLGLERVNLLGNAIPGRSALRLAAERPELAERLILISLADGHDFERYPQLRAVLDLAKLDWKLYTETWARMFGSWTGNEGTQSAEFIRRSISQDVFVRALEYAEVSDLEVYLPNVRARTLVMNDVRGRSGSRETATLLASGIKGARFSEYHRGRYYSSTETIAIIDEFLSESEASGAPGPIPSGTAIILFADIVDSTALTERLGDTAFREKARDLDAAMRTIIRDHSGTAIEGKLLGDGVLAVFTSASQAIGAALSCARASDYLALHLGLHAGDVIREENNVYGGAVNIASRISALSAPGEVLVSDTVRSLARTSAGVSFVDRGEQDLKGIGEPVRVWEVLSGEIE